MFEVNWWMLRTHLALERSHQDFPQKKEHIVLTKSPVERLPTKKYSEPSYPIASMYAMFEVHIYMYILYHKQSS